MRELTHFNTLKFGKKTKLVVYLHWKVKGKDAHPYSMGIIIIGDKNYGN